MKLIHCPSARFYVLFKCNYVLINAVESKMSYFKIKHLRCKEMEILIEGTS